MVFCNDHACISEARPFSPLLCMAHAFLKHNCVSLIFLKFLINENSLILGYMNEEYCYCAIIEEALGKGNSQDASMEPTCGLPTHKELYNLLSTQ